MKLSIVITYHNRRQQLINTLYSIEATIIDYPVEIIIVDDKSDEPIDDIKDIFELPIKLIKRDTKERIDPVVPLNIGFEAATGDVILINCAECYHFGNILECIFRNFTENDYFAFSTYSLNWTKFRKLKIERGFNNVREVIEPTHPLPKYWQDCWTGWYAHPQHRYILIPFCACISTSNMEKLNGFDERFKDATGWADIDFVDRVKNLKLNTVLVEYPFCIHQPHALTDYSGPLNNQLYERLRHEEPDRIKSPDNKYYKR